MSDVPTLAPLFDLQTPAGGHVSLSGLLQQGRVLLVFHRGTW